MAQFEGLKVIELQEFLAFLERVKKEKYFRIKLQKLNGFLTKVENHSWSCWIRSAIPGSEKCMRALLHEGPWYSNLTSEENFVNGLGKKFCTPCAYWFIRIYEEGHDDANSRPLISLRVDKRGEFGELVWLQKASQCLSGTNTYDLFKRIDDCLQVRVMFLHDDAKFIMNGSVAKGRQDCEIYLKMLRSVAVDQSWYQAKGYQPLTIPPYSWNIQGKGEEEKYYHQSAERFQDAITCVQNTSLEALQNIYMTNENLKKKWDNLFISLQGGREGDPIRSPVPVLPQHFDFDETRPLTRSKSEMVCETQVPKIIGWRRKVKFKFDDPPIELEAEANTTKHPRTVKDVMNHVYRMSQISRHERVRNQKRKRISDDVLKRAYEVFLVRKIGRIDLPEEDAFLKEYEEHLEEIEQTKVFAFVRRGELPIVHAIKREVPPPQLEFPTPPKRKKQNRKESRSEGALETPDALTSGRLEGVKRKRSNHDPNTLLPLGPSAKRRKFHNSGTPMAPVLQATPSKARASPSMSPVVTFGSGFHEDVLEEVLRLTMERYLELLKDEEMVDWVASYPYNIHYEHQPDHMRGILSDAVNLIQKNRKAPKFVMATYRDAAANIIESSEFPPEKFIPFLPKCIEFEEGDSDTADSNSPPNTPPFSNFAISPQVNPKKEDFYTTKVEESPSFIGAETDSLEQKCISLSFVDSPFPNEKNEAELFSSARSSAAQSKSSSVSSDFEDSEFELEEDEDMNQEPFQSSTRKRSRRPNQRYFAPVYDVN